MVTAQYKAGKTTLVNNLVKSFADGEPFIGGPVRNLTGRIGLWNYEVTKAQELEWLRALSIRNTDAVTIVHLRGQRTPLQLDVCREWTINWLKSEQIELWILDPFARAFSGGGDENSNSDVGAWLENLDEIKREAGVTDLILTTHSGRADADRTRGATRLDDWADSLWTLSKDDDGRRWFGAIGRGVDVAPFALDFDPKTGRVTASGDLTTRQQATRDANAQRFAAMVAEHEGANTNTLEDYWPKNKNLFGPAKRAALTEGLIHVHPVGNSKLHYLGPGQDGCHRS